MVLTRVQEVLSHAHHQEHCTGLTAMMCLQIKKFRNLIPVSETVRGFGGVASLRIEDTRQLLNVLEGSCPLISCAAFEDEMQTESAA